MQDRIRVKKIVKAVIEKAKEVKDNLAVDELIRQAEAQVKRQYKNFKERRKDKQ